MYIMVNKIEHIYDLIDVGFGVYRLANEKTAIGFYDDIFKRLKFNNKIYDDFLVDIFGNVYNIKKQSLVKTKRNHKNGYVYVRLDLKDYPYSWVLLHRVVAYTYIENPLNLPEVDHVDGDKTNNAPSNLEWVSDHENKVRAVKNGLFHSGFNHYESRFTEDSLNKLWHDLLNTKLTFRELAVKYNVEPSTIREIYIGKRYTSIRDKYKKFIPDSNDDWRLHKSTNANDVLKARRLYEKGELSLSKISKLTGVQPYYIKRRTDSYYSKLYDSIK